MNEAYDLDRFIRAQQSFDTYQRALREIKNGREESRWMLYFFPDFKGLA